MRVIVGNRSLNLSKNNFVGQGGEGSIYIKSGIAYKIYTEPQNMIPEGKIHELQALTAPEIIRPQEVILSDHKVSIGYTMKALTNTHPLCKLFTKAFKQRNGLTSDNILVLVQSMRDTMEHIHKANILVVDANELNFLVNSAFETVYFIDVDSYQTKHFPATAIMDSIRDRHSGDNFSTATDWFSWGIVTWQLITGIHPYKGKHPKMKTLDDRMLNNVSVMNPEVKVPSICPPWADVIPANYLEWYKAVFEDGKRIPPPIDFVGTITLSAPIVKIVSGTNTFRIVEIDDMGEEIIRTQASSTWGGRGLVIFSINSLKLHKKRWDVDGRSSHVSEIRACEHPATVQWNPNRTLTVSEVFGPATLDKPLSDISGVMSYKGQVYTQQEGGLYEMILRKVGTRLLCGFELRANVLPKASYMYDGVVIQNILGAWFATILPEPGICYTIPLCETKHHKIIDAKFENGVLMIIGAKSGAFDKFIYRFGPNYEPHVRIISDPSSQDINFTVTGTGICAHVLEDGKLELFRNNPNSKDVKVIEDPIIHGDMRLFTDGAGVKFFQGSKIYSIEMK